MNKKKSASNKNTAIKNSVTFCAECGEDLSMFGIEGEVDRKAVEERHHRCKEKGKFKGDVCSMMFISDEKELPPLSDEAV
jgi:hypothetical protein